MVDEFILFFCSLNFYFLKINKSCAREHDIFNMYREKNNINRTDDDDTLTHNFRWTSNEIS